MRSGGRPCPCGRGGPNFNNAIPQYCPSPLSTRNTTKPTSKPTHRICSKRNYLSCNKDKSGKKMSMQTYSHIY